MSQLAALHLPSGATMTAGVDRRLVRYMHATSPDPLNPSGVLSGDDELLDRVHEILGEGDAGSDTWINVPSHPKTHRGVWAPIPWLFPDSRDSLPDLLLAMALSVGNQGWLSDELAGYLVVMVDVGLDSSETAWMQAEFDAAVNPWI